MAKRLYAILKYVQKKSCCLCMKCTAIEICIKCVAQIKSNGNSNENTFRSNNSIIVSTSYFQINLTPYSESVNTVTI